ncbi:MAG: DUF2064 domain-containing protein [Owenweeksia sp.]|nr:DUF2064 domain-containing protein [Owenweeksia sp.]
MSREDLQHRDAILGPCQDGGDYLIALSKEVFDFQEFINLPWQSAGLHQSMAERFLVKTSSLQVLPHA